MEKKKVSCAHYILSRSHKILFRAHDIVSRSHEKVTGAPSRKWSTEETTVSLQTVVFMWRNGSAYII